MKERCVKRTRNLQRGVSEVCLTAIEVFPQCAQYESTRVALKAYLSAGVPISAS